MGEGVDDPCAAKGVGWHCGRSGTCEPCESGVEVCDGRDNDCDMEVDEGLEDVAEKCNGDDDDCDGMIDEGHDLDGDGVTWCGGGTPSLRDCDDGDREVRPGLTALDRSEAPAFEACDGKDNDCDQQTDERDETGQRAACEQQNCQEVPCSGDLHCDPASNRCLAPRSIGSPCASDAECGPGFCIETRAVGLERELGDERVCATACCRDTDCPVDAACVVHRGGIRVCLPLHISGRRAGGASCNDRSQCASGVCDGRICRAPCKSRLDCGGGQTCSVAGGATFGNPIAWACGAAEGRRTAGQACFVSLQRVCESGMCQSETGTCAEPCGVDADCPDAGRCDFRVVRSLFGDSWLSVCVDADQAEPAPTCCTSIDCDSARCSPRTEGERTVMRCQAGPS
ncbi:MAG: putative metal-binding motif-containing protein [Myxococcales bacterium]|nr:putative metal-binding motif-containing protein [Myxococcales bacterium]